MRLPPRIVALSPGTLEGGDVDGFLERVRAALGGGLRGILFREPRLGDGAWAAAFAALREAAADVEGTWLAAHDRVHLALAAAADAVHLGFRSLPASRVRAMVPAAMAVGVSTHEGDEPTRWDGADYVFRGPVHATPSKEGWKDPVGFEGLARAVAEVGLPVLGIGGLSPADASAVAACGAHGMAVRAGILGAPDPAAAARLYGAGPTSTAEGADA